jgi:hypothetical protein
MYTGHASSYYQSESTHKFCHTCMWIILLCYLFNKIKIVSITALAVFISIRTKGSHNAETTMVSTYIYCYAT